MEIIWKIKEISTLFLPSLISRFLTLRPSSSVCCGDWMQPPWQCVVAAVTAALVLLTGPHAVTGHQPVQQRDRVRRAVPPQCRHHRHPGASALTSLWRPCTRLCVTAWAMPSRRVHPARPGSPRITGPHRPDPGSPDVAGGRRVRRHAPANPGVHHGRRVGGQAQGDGDGFLRGLADARRLSGVLDGALPDGSLLRNGAGVDVGQKEIFDA